jgi:hypothetical protein
MGLLVKLDGTKKITVVRHGNGRHLKLFSPRKEVIKTNRSIEE